MVPWELKCGRCVEIKQVQLQTDHHIPGSQCGMGRRLYVQSKQAFTGTLVCTTVFNKIGQEEMESCEGNSDRLKAKRCHT